MHKTCNTHFMATVNECRLKRGPHHRKQRKEHNPNLFVKIYQQTTITEVVKNEFLGLRIGNNDPGT